MRRHCRPAPGHVHGFLAVFLSAVLLMEGAAQAADTLRAGIASIRPGGHASLAVSASRDEAIQGFQVSLWVDPASLTLVAAGYAGTAVEPLAPEFFDTSVDPVAGNVTAALLFEVSPPFDLVSLPPSPDTFDAILAVDLDAAVTASGIIPVVLRDGAGARPFRNIFTSLGTTIFPALEDGSVSILTPQFRRGYLNDDLRVDLSDAIFLLAWLFTGGAPPACPAAADVNGDGRVDLADPIRLLAYIFSGGGPPPEPFAACGDVPAGSKLRCAPGAACP